jgi:hypothetical protein
MVYFKTKNHSFVQILEGVAKEDVGIFFGHLVNFPAIWDIL